MFRPTRVDTGEVLRSFVSASLALGLAIPWVEVGLVLPSVPMFIDPDLFAVFTKHLSPGLMQTLDDGANLFSFGGRVRKPILVGSRPEADGSALQVEGFWGDASTTAASLVSRRNVNVSWR